MVEQHQDVGPTRYSSLLAFSIHSTDAFQDDGPFRPAIDFVIPMFFVEGAHDLLATPDVARRCYDSLKAPQKAMVVLERSGHDPNQDVVDAEYKILRKRILPLTR